jgi:hypothetical protein
MLCSTEARAAGLSGRFVALLATSSSSALSRVDLTQGPWTRTDGVPFVGAATDLMTRPLSALSVRANGTYSEPVLVWTGIGGPACSDWSSSMDTDSGILGYAAETDPAAWDTYLVEPCNFARGHLYCLQD